MQQKVRYAVSAAILLASNGLAFAQDEVWRYFVSDHEKAQITVFEKEVEPRVWTDFAAPARLYMSGDGTRLFAVQRAIGRIDFARTGLSYEDHGDHQDPHMGEAQWNGLFLTGHKPTHFVVHDQSVAAFMDGTGSVQRIDLAEEDLQHQVSFAVSARPHHGVAVPFDGHLLISEPSKDSDSSLPDFVRVLDREMKEIGEPHACKGLHGEASSGNKTAFACVDGILVFDAADYTSSQFLSYPEELGEGRTGRLDGGQGIQLFAGNFGKNKMIFVDVESEGHFVSTQFDAGLVAGYLDPENAAQAFVLTADGNMHIVNALSGSIVQSTSILAPIDMEGGHGAARPSFVFAGENLALVDPIQGHLRLIRKSDLASVETIEVGGKPSSIVAVGAKLEDH
ncbi:hypothetical protein [uncultured Maritalea sp.]|uniref:hypothetical protein n=1 Tax=uncultured Maritalea sp. TaxID=757249 RepID=UPI00260D90A9|nr:hypothetical protein [uncultured Maritalea sp.]